MMKGEHSGKGYQQEGLDADVHFKKKKKKKVFM